MKQIQLLAIMLISILFVVSCVEIQAISRKVSRQFKKGFEKVCKFVPQTNGGHVALANLLKIKVGKIKNSKNCVTAAKAVLSLGRNNKKSFQEISRVFKLVAVCAKRLNRKHIAKRWLNVHKKAKKATPAQRKKLKKVC